MTYKDNSSDLEVRDLILTFEKQCDPFKYQIEGFCIWPVVRFITFENIKINRGGFTTRGAIKSRDKLFRLIRFLPEFTKDIKKIMSLSSHRDDLNILAFTGKGRFRDKVNGTYKNIYFDFFSPPLKNIIFWHKYDDRFDRFYSLILNKKSGILGRFLEEFRFNQYEIMKFLYRDFTTYLKGTDYGYSFNLKVSRWINKLKTFVSHKRVFESLLQSLNPKILLIECSYGKEGAIAAAKSMNIPVWELQHGIFYDGHMAYTYDQKSAGNYKTQLPLPDKILTYGKYFSKVLTERGFWQKSDVPEIGFPRLEYFKHKIFQNKIAGIDNLKVLISSQWILVDEIVSYLRQVVPKLPDGIRILVKPHPLESGNHIRKYKALGNSVEIINKDLSFYDVLSECHVHCAVFSTTLFESIGMGIPTIIINLPGAEHAYSIAENRCGKIAKSPMDFIDILKKLKTDRNYLIKWRDETINNQSYFWEPYPGRKIQNLFIKHIPGL